MTALHWLLASIGWHLGAITLPVVGGGAAVLYARHLLRRLRAGLKGGRR